MLTVHVLGPVEVRRDGVALDLGGPQQRAVIAHLAIDVGRVVSVERLIDRLWGEEPPRRVADVSDGTDGAWPHPSGSYRHCKPVVRGSQAGPRTMWA